MDNPWINKLEEQLKTTTVYRGPGLKKTGKPGGRKLMWDEQVKGNTLTGGDVLEFGVASGNSIGWFPKNMPGTKVYGFDSFYGLPEDWDLGNKILSKGYFSTDGVPPIIKGVEYIKGEFSESFPKWFKNYRGFASIIHIDCDLYSSAKLVLKYVKPHLRVGTFILFDELTHHEDHPQYLYNRQHEYKAFEEFLKDNPTFDYEVIGRTEMCQVGIKITSL
jgi:predicted O-methyltransferase YrrM